MTVYAEALANTLVADQDIRSKAEKFLKDAETENYPNFLVGLGQVLFASEQPSHIRQSAAITLKNAIKLKGFDINSLETTPWSQLPVDTKQQIKDALLNTLNDGDTRVSNMTAQVIAVIAEIELPSQAWPELMPTLLERSTGASEPEKLSSLLTLGLICETIAQSNPNVLVTYSNHILNAVISNAHPSTVPNPNVRLVAIKALTNSIEFIHGNFYNPPERNYIMEVVCSNTQCPEEELQVAAFQCLIEIVQIYYEHMQQYFEQLTGAGLRDDKESVVLQAIEFWAAVSETEISIGVEGYDEDVEDSTTNHHFVLAALPNILPFLLELMTRQDEDADEFEWNAPRAATSCLSLIAKAVQDPIVDAVIPFVKANINNPNWRFREASVMSFGSILDGPAPSKLNTLITQAFYPLLGLMNDQSELVRDTVSWTLGRICDLHPECIDPRQQLPDLLLTLVKGVENSPHIITNCCWAIMNLVQAFSVEPYDKDLPLSGYFAQLLHLLLNLSQTHSTEVAARTSAYETVVTLVQHCPPDQIKIIENVALEAINRLEQTLVMEDQANVISAQEYIQTLQGSICGVLSASIVKLKEGILPVADKIMEILLRMLNTSKSPAIAEDIFLCMGSMINGMNASFSRYLEAFAPHLLAALHNPEEFRLCRNAIGLLGDICRVLGEESTNYVATFVQILGQNLENIELDEELRAAIFVCFGDIATAVGPQYKPYLAPSMNVLGLFMTQLTGQIIQYRNADALTSLFEAVMDSYVGLVQAFREPEFSNELLPYLEQIFTSLEFCNGLEDRSDELSVAMLGLIGDLGSIFPNGQLAGQLNKPWIYDFLYEFKSNRYPKSTRKLGKWATNMVKKACGNS